MIFGLEEADFFTFLLFGLIANFLFSIMFGLLINSNVGVQDLMKLVQKYKQPWWMPFTIIVPFAKMVLTLYRVYILQVYFLNRGKSYYDFLVYTFEKESTKR